MEWVVEMLGDDRIVGGRERRIFHIMKRWSRHVKVRAAAHRSGISQMIMSFRNTK
ncbi:hypothetical protein [Achromobacter deleyi]|uniref:hypothetical protein n=1 Tax=Achromobacter deleyi TaxID=1353891 RepID=UPI0015821AD7|nr:hypothetical protein [Achromobacter deleyi]